MERGLTYAFTPERDIGFMINNRHFNKRLAWFAGYFFPTGGVGKYLGNQYRLTFRLTGLPLYKPEGRYTILHLGIAYENQFQNNEEFSLYERPEAHLAPKYVNLEIDAVNRADVFGGELSFVSGRFAVQGEFMLARVKAAKSSTALHSIYNYDAYYGNFSWFITGEHRNYSKKKAAYDRITPKKNLGKGGAGAWELTVRVSHIDLDDKDLNGGAMTDFTAGINWYLNPATRFMFNYIHSNVIGSDNTDLAMVRFQVAF
jgi:phosphate-selective porin OprO/OprP